MEEEEQNQFEGHLAIALNNVILAQNDHKNDLAEVNIVDWDQEYPQPPIGATLEDNIENHKTVH